MYLKSLTLRGFKSFPDRTRLEFGPGVSVIVGPNGSGKSNITDAVLWALGEQSPVAVRGQSMQDVIFGGAPGRQASKGAEVELVLDDGDGSLDLGVPEISILRRLDRAGEGEYRLAGARCRLVDVIELLSDTGLGKEMHSVISQGRIEAIVTSKPRERRMLIEEAAGLGKHRKRRRRAQLKLDRTRGNLDRALDVEREARARLRPLKRQAEAAELHARLERQMLELRWQLARDELRSQQLALAAAQAASTRAREERQQVERELGTVAQRREAAEEALAARSAHREELSRRRFVAQGALERVSYRGDSVRSAAGSIEGRLARARGQLERLEAAAAAEPPDDQARSRIAALESTLAALERDREAELQRELAELQAERQRAAVELEARTAALSTSRSMREQADERLEQGRAALREAERGAEAARREAARVGGELAAVNQFLRSHESSAGGAAALADELEVDSGYELALAAALDGRLGAAVVADRAAAARLLDRAGVEGGRALVLEANGAGADRSGEEQPVPGAERLAARVRGRGEAVALVHALLADTWVVEELAQLPPTFTGVGVTRSGRVWAAAARELRQAPAVGEERVLAERNRREELIRASEAAAQGELAVQVAVQQAASELARLEGERERAVAADRAAVRDRDEASEAQRRIEAQIERRRAAPDDGPQAPRRAQLRAELTAERAALQQAERARIEREGWTERLRSTIAADEALGPVLTGLIEALASAASAIAEQQSSFEDALAADREAGEHIAAELRTCAQQEAGLQSQLHARNEAVTQSEVALERTRDRAGDVQADLSQLAARLELEAGPADEELAEEDRHALSDRLERLVRRREQLGPVNPLAQEEYAEALEHVEELEHQRTDLETALRELQKLISDTDREIRETFEQMFQAAARNFEDVTAQLFPGGTGRLRLVSEREGPPQVLGGPRGAAAGAEASADDEPASDEESEPDTEEDPLGVEIEITPGGKEMKRLTLLSGGEKSMTALAFLFAVFLARPCPFYILDEVEAALDDLNIDRFLEILRRYSKQAQFIVVTHQKRTMEAADSLYGVSMGPDGISKVISRRLPQAEAA